MKQRRQQVSVQRGERATRSLGQGKDPKVSSLTSENDGTSIPKALHDGVGKSVGNTSRVQQLVAKGALVEPIHATTFMSVLK